MVVLNPDHVWKVDHNQMDCKHPDVFCPNGYPVIDFVNNVAAKNVQLTIEKIIKDSTVLAEMQQSGEINIVGGMYDIHSGAVTFYE